jgi:hypothetical protein
MKRAIALIVVLSSAAYDAAYADPQLVSETRSVPDFHAVDLAGVIDVYVTVGQQASVVLSGEPDAIDKVTTKVKDGVLVVATRRDLPKHTQHLKATVTVPDVTLLSLSGVGDLKVTGIANHSLTVNLSGVGSLKVAGTTGSLRVDTSGTGDVSAKDLAAKASTVVSSGVGDTKVSASESIDATLSGVGDINIYGHPQQVRKSRSGVGDIRFR